MNINAEQWVRDGSIIGPGGEQVDIRCDPEGRNWITVKGPDCEAIIAAVLALPQLLAALKIIEPMVRSRKDHKTDEVWNAKVQARAAIEAAEG